VTNPDYPPPAPPQYPYAAPLPTSTMAVVSLVSGILGFVALPIVGSIVAIITGIMARGETRSLPPRASGDGMATAGVIMGWVGIGLWVVGGLCTACLFIFPLLLAVPFSIQGG
jgi:hypothetical protein